MTIWPGRTQRSIVSSFAAAPESSTAHCEAWCHGRAARSAQRGAGRVARTVQRGVMGGRRVPYSVAAPVGAATPTTPIDPLPFAKKSKPAVHKAFTIDGTQLKICLKIEAFT